MPGEGIKRLVIVVSASNGTKSSCSGVARPWQPPVGSGCLTVAKPDAPSETGRSAHRFGVAAAATGPLIPPRALPPPNSSRHLWLAPVRLVDDITGYPAGSSGKVALANGMTWKRYWVRFPDGNAVDVDHQSLVKAKDYDEFLVARGARRSREKGCRTRRGRPTSGAGADSNAGSSGGGAGVEVNGVFIDQSWLDWRPLRPEPGSSAAANSAS